MRRRTMIAALVCCSLSSYGQVFVTATVYNAIEGQTDDTPLVTASNKRINPDKPQRWMAVSRDLEAMCYTLGSKVCVENAGPMNGEWAIEDRMNKRWRRKVDFLVHDTIKLGRWMNVKIYLK